MTRKRRPKGDPIEQEIELVLNPGAFIPYGACFSFVSDLDEVATQIANLVSSDPARAVSLYETFLAACYVKIEELDDSGGTQRYIAHLLPCAFLAPDIMEAIIRGDIPPQLSLGHLKKGFPLDWNQQRVALGFTR